MRNRALISILASLGAIVAATGALAAGEKHVSVQVVDQRGMPIRDAVVEIERPATSTGAFSFPWRNAMAQRNLAFTPGTLIVPRGSVVAFPNLDTVRHSIYSFSRAARFKFDLYGRDQSRTQRFDVSGTVALGCNIHDQMRGYVRVVNTPFAAKTDQNGIARVEGLGGGSYRVTIWHPQLRAPNNEQSEMLSAPASGQPVRAAVILR
ncbi:methylamine utilization protein [Novosphingobium sp. PS1R-30]|uniref:Methylamine utilization protein n=1 Tax=Novosphingobium anseongense TaxID=3133436 RepID=A0ABU8S2I9_9SPHN